MCTLANSEDPDKMPPHGAFHQVLQYLLRQKQSSENEAKFLFENYNPLIYTMDHLKVIVSNQKEESISV